VDHKQAVIPAGELKFRISLASNFYIQESNEPLYVVDGQFLGHFHNVNVNDIQSMEVFKRTLLQTKRFYGTLGGQRAYLITTKKRSAQGKP